MTGQPRTVTQDEAGRPCPYCRFALKPGAIATECPTCRAPHHSDCWADNEGCAIVGCASGPNQMGIGKPPAAAGALVQPAAVPAAAAPVAAATSPAAPAPAATPTGRRRPRWLLIGVALLAVAAVGGVGVATALRGDPDETVPGSSPRGAVPTGANPDEEVQAPTTTVRTIPDDDETGSPDVSTKLDGTETDAERRVAIRRVLLAHHRAIHRGDFAGAWVLTSTRYRAKKRRERGGYPAWAEGQKLLKRYLSPEGLQVSIRSFDASTGVATIRATGMGWSAPSSPCNTFEGITWAQLDGGKWRYEPGYSISPQRRSMWQPRRTELLGWGC